MRRPGPMQSTDTSSGSARGDRTRTTLVLGTSLGHCCSLSHATGGCGGSRGTRVGGPPLGARRGDSSPSSTADTTPGSPGAFSPRLHSRPPPRHVEETPGSRGRGRLGLDLVSGPPAGQNSSWFVPVNLASSGVMLRPGAMVAQETRGGRTSRARAGRAEILASSFGASGCCILVGGPPDPA